MLKLQNVGVEIHDSYSHVFTPVRNVSFHAAESEITAVIGESGSGKTLTALAIMRLLQEDQMNVAAGSKIEFKGKSLLDISPAEMSRLRGKEISMIFQNPGASLNPVLTIGRQLSEPLMRHTGLSKQQAWIRASELLDDVGIELPSKRLKAYPHELSGGQQQRIMIAMALACDPSLLIADEPTSALDVTIQRQIIDLIIRMKEERNLSILFISHDLSIVAEIADHIVVMQDGVVVEEGESSKVMRMPEHDYTKSLVEARLTIEKTRAYGNGKININNQSQSKQGVIGKREPSGVRLEARDLNKRYWLRTGVRQKHALDAVKDVSFELQAGETLGVVGESGSGKTTLAMLLMRLVDPTSGSIILDGRPVHDISMKAFRPMRRKIQMIFQNPYASFNPRWKIQEALTAPMKLHGVGNDFDERRDKAIELLVRVGLSSSALDKYPHQFSGGECQRVAIARCLAVQPEILICDECVSALDVHIQIQILDLLCELQRESALSFLFIAHDLATIKYMCNRVLVFHNGEVVEMADTEQLFSMPKHPYTRRLMAATPGIAERM